MSALPVALPVSKTCDYMVNTGRCLITLWPLTDLTITMRPLIYASENFRCEKKCSLSRDYKQCANDNTDFALM